MGRVLRGTFKLAVIGGVVTALVAAGRKLMGGLGPEPGSPEAPQAWPSLVPDPAPATTTPATTTPTGTAPPAQAAPPVESVPPVDLPPVDPAPPAHTDSAEFTELTPSDAQPE